MAQAAASAVGEQLREAFAGGGPVVLGPAALFRLRGRERRVLVVKAPERRPAVAAVGEAVQLLASARTHAGVNFSVDVDPQ
jgi:primosomal protein N'